MRRVTFAAAALAAACPAAAQVQQKVTPPIAVYWMSIETAGGMGISVPAGLGGFLPPGMQGGKRMHLELGSSQAASAEPQAVHGIPPGLSMGTSLPLVTPRTERSPVQSGGPAEREPQQPKGRMLIYWGCGEAVRPGQPVVFDFAKMDPQEAARVFRSRTIARPTGPAFGRNRSYGSWPNAQSSIAVPAQGLLRGDHVVSGNYSPEIRFAIDERHDFMDPVSFEPVRRTPSGAALVKWQSIPTAIGYFATAIGRGESDTDMVMWSSSDAQDMGSTLMDYVPPAEVQRLIREKVVMAPQTTECAVPAGIFKQEGAMLNFIAYGDELNFVHPPRPGDPKVPWEQQWAAKVRLKSTGSTLLAETERGAPRAQQAPQREQEAQPQQGTAPKPPSAADAVREGVNVLRGIFGR